MESASSEHPASPEDSRKMARISVTASVAPTVATVSNALSMSEGCLTTTSCGSCASPLIFSTSAVALRTFSTASDMPRSFC